MPGRPGLATWTPPWAALALAGLAAAACASACFAGVSHPSLESLDGAANLLTAAADGRAAGSTCGISPDEARTLLRALHAMLDEETDRYLGSRRKAHLPLIQPGWQEHDCAGTCHCGLYASILRKGGDARGAAGFEAKAAHQDITNCARQEQWFCRSTLLKGLRGKATQLKPAESGI